MDDDMNKARRIAREAGKNVQDYLREQIAYAEYRGWWSYARRARELLVLAV